jgi:hypothetical protein
MRNINESHFGPDSVKMINFTYQNVKRKKSKGSIKGKFVLVEQFINEFIDLMNSFILIMYVLVTIPTKLHYW